MCLLCQARDPNLSTYDTHVQNAGTASTLPDSTQATLPSYTLDQVGAQLTDGYWNATGRSWRAFDVESGGVLTYDISALNSAGRSTAIQAFEAWSAASGLRFEAVTSGAADITFMDDYAGAYAYSYVSGHTITQSYVNVQDTWQAYGGYYLQTYIHEIGHALGLGHAGNYNGSADFASDATYQQDSWQYTLMSYFAQWENTYTDATYNFIATPQMGDIAAILSLYGLSTTSNTGDTVYGDSATLGQTGMSLSTSWAVTLNDSSGRDTINLGSRGSAQRLDLRDESFSDINGEVGNLAIMRGTVIENAITGSGHDHITTNDADNNILSGGGNDTLIGSQGHDTLDGGAGEDLLQIEGLIDSFAFDVDGDMVLTHGTGSMTLSGVETIAFADGTGVTGSAADGDTLEFTASGEGYVSRRVTFDTGNAHDWRTQTDTLDTDGTLTRRVTLFDDGRTETETFTPATGPQVETLTDDANTENWSSVTRTRSTEGELISEQMIMDNGIIRDTTFTNGVADRTVATDAENVAVWTTCTDDFDANGDLVQRALMLDDGTEREISYTNGVRSASVHRDTSDIKNWDISAIQYAADGSRAAQQISYDNGLYSEVTYQNDQVALVQGTDTADTYVWSSYTASFDQNGNRLSLNIIRDDGILVESQFNNGDRVASQLTDMNNQFRWDRIENEFDRLGRLSQQDVTMDDGREMRTLFDAGQRLQRTTVDAADQKIWTSHTDFFDFSGQRVRTEVLRDNGTEVDITFLNGIRSSLTVRDSADLYGWDCYTITYDTTGSALERVLTRDDGQDVVTWLHQTIDAPY